MVDAGTLDTGYSVTSGSSVPVLELIAVPCLGRFILDNGQKLRELNERIKNDPAERQAFNAWAAEFYK